MKAYLASVFLLASAIAGHAATVAGASFSAPLDTNDFVVVFAGTNTAVTTGTGNVSVGVFATLTTTQVQNLATLGTAQAIAQLAADFTVLGSSTFGFNGVSGLYSVSANGTYDANAGKTFYTFLSSGAGVGAGQVGLYAHDDVVLTEGPTTPRSYSLILGDGSATVRGTSPNATQQLVLGANTVTVSSYALFNPIPEPSSMLLGAVGALGLLRRRR